MAKVSVTDAFPSKWLSSSDLDDEEIIATLANEPLEYEEFKQQGKDVPERKPVLYFRSVRDAKKLKPMVLNKINFTTLIMLLGDDTDTWAGRQIRIGVDEVEAFGKRTLGLRIRTKLPQAKTNPALAKIVARSTPEPDDQFDDSPNDNDIPF